MTGQYQPGQGFVASPRLALAQALMAQGASREPVRSPLEGIARVLTAGIGGWVGSGVKKDQQDALAEALKALESPDVPETARAKAAYQAYATKSPDTPNPFEGIMLSQMVPKEKFIPVKNDRGQTIGQQSTLTGKIEPYKLENVGAGTTAVNPFGEAVAVGGPKLGEGQVFDPKTNTISTVPNFTQSLAEIEGAKAGGRMAGELPYVGRTEAAKNPALIARAGGTAQATKDVDLRMTPQIEAATIAATTPGLVARAGQTSEATTAGTARGNLTPTQLANGQTVPAATAVARATGVGQRQAENAVPTAPTGYQMGEEGVAPLPGGPADPVQIEQAARAQATGAGTLSNQQTTNAAKLRDDFNALPTVKAYREVLPIYESMQDAATRDSKAADLNIVYGLAKIMDPGSVVREGEIVMANDTQGVADKLNGFIHGIQGEGRLRPEVRQQLLGEAASRVGSIKTVHDQAASQFTEMAQRAGVNPKDVILSFNPPKMDQKMPELPRVTDDAAGRLTWEKLAPGQSYIAPDGNTYIKPPSGGTR